ncbi:MAG: translational GTPase TypA [Planctomycetota bacterium]|nr:MAG: translational GTPase TypA [Planctomycetota bacterium]
MQEIRRTDIRNIAIIAHVDHGKTTLVDALFKQAGVFRAGQQVAECVMDSDDQERERGITILAKNCAVTWEDIRLNLIDTPGHADFGGEVERVLRMADGVLLLVDAFEGPMPQTRFVLRKALENGLKPLVVVNKVDKPGCRPQAVVDEVFDLMVDLDAQDWQLDFPVLYGSGRDGWMTTDLDERTQDCRALFESIIREVPGPAVRPGAPLQLQVANLDHNDFVGRIAIGRVYAGSINAGDRVAVVKDANAVPRPGRVLQLHTFDGLGRREIKQAEAGDIVLVTGLDGIDISDTICDPQHPNALPPIPIDEPTIRMTFGVTTSPMAGQDGKPLQSRELKARLDRECERNVALRVAETDAAEVFEVAGRGLLHLSVLIENMRREGFELQVGPPRVILKEGDRGERLEPMELAVVDVPEESSSRVMALILERRGELQSMSNRGDLQHLEFIVPSRGLIGLRTQLLTATRGEAILNTVFQGYAPWCGELSARRNGVILSMGPGEAVAYAIWNLQDRGRFFIEPGDVIYEGMICGENSKESDLTVNLTKSKQLTNVRSSGADDAIKIVPVTRPTLEEALEYIGPDELVEVTPHHIRLRKAMLKEVDRKRASRQ